MNSVFYFILLFFASFLNSQNVKGQKIMSTLKKKMITADSIVLVSHIAPPEIYRSGIDNPNDFKLLIKGKVNEKVIKEKKVLNNKLTGTLSNIVSHPFSDSIEEKGMCFIPHHAILIYKSKKISFIDLCFLCQEFETSSDIKIPAGDFDLAIWKSLKLFFRKQGFKYGFE